MIEPQAPIALSVHSIIWTIPRKPRSATRAPAVAKVRATHDNLQVVAVLLQIIAKVTAKSHWSRTSMDAWSSREVRDSLMIATETWRFPMSMGMPQVGPTRRTPRSYRAWNKVFRASTCLRMHRLYRSRRRLTEAITWRMRSEPTALTLLATRSRTWRLA